MVNLEGDNIRTQYLSKILPPKLARLTKYVPIPSKFLLSNNFSDSMGTIETSQKMLQTYSNSFYYKNSKNVQRFPNALEMKTRGTAAAAKPEVTATTKNNNKDINDRNTTRETELH